MQAWTREFCEKYKQLPSRKKIFSIKWRGSIDRWSNGNEACCNPPPLPKHPYAIAQRVCMEIFKKKIAIFDFNFRNWRRGKTKGARSNFLKSHKISHAIFLLRFSPNFKRLGNSRSVSSFRLFRQKAEMSTTRQEWLSLVDTIFYPLTDLRRRATGGGHRGVPAGVGAPGDRRGDRPAQVRTEGWGVEGPLFVGQSQISETNQEFRKVKKGK